MMCYYKDMQSRTVCTIVPPHILEEISKKGTPKEKEFASNTLAVSLMVRKRRLTLTPDLKRPVALKKREIHDAKHTETLPGVLVRKESGAVTKDSAVNDTYDASGYTYDLYKDIFLRNSIDQKGMTLVSSVHYGEKYDNAFWN